MNKSRRMQLVALWNNLRIARYQAAAEADDADPGAPYIQALLREQRLTRLMSIVKYRVFHPR